MVIEAPCEARARIPVETARALGAVPHAGELLHLIFLYSLMLNGVEVVRSIR